MWRKLMIGIKKAFNNEGGYYTGSIKRMFKNEQLRDQYRCDNCSGKGERIINESRDANGRTVRIEPCRVCFGHGVEVKTCPKCKGKTFIIVTNHVETGAIIRKECYVCKGKKRVSCYTCHEGQLDCHICKGAGELEVKETLEKKETKSCDACRATGFAPIFYENI